MHTVCTRDARAMPTRCTRGAHAVHAQVPRGHTLYPLFWAEQLICDEYTAAVVAQVSCHPPCWRLPPSMLEAATLYAGGCYLLHPKHLGFWVP